jgi:hypothetical protein
MRVPLCLDAEKGGKILFGIQFSQKRDFSPKTIKRFKNDFFRIHFIVLSSREVAVGLESVHV